MKLALVVFVASTLSIAAPSPAWAQTTGTLAADVLSDWQDQKDRLTAIADAMPEATFDYKSTPEQRSYGEQIMHVVEINGFVLGSLGAKTEAPAINMKATTKADILQALEQSFDYGTAALREIDDAAMTATVDGPRWLGRSTRARIAYYVIAHAMDIYGQMAVYLRLNGIVPPASRRSL